MNKGKLYLIPTVISEDTQSAAIPPDVLTLLPRITYFLVENVRTSRRYLSSLKVYESIEPLHFELLDKDTTQDQLSHILKPLFEGKDVGVLSESGCPAIADPGSLAVQYAHQNDVEVVPLVGPSSLVLALMASGLNGQRFSFHGYLPIDTSELTKAIKDLERESRNRKQTQMFIETPYRNNSLMSALLRNLQDTTMITVALDLTGKNQYVKTKTVREWKTHKPEFPKTPAVFLVLASL